MRKRESSPGPAQSKGSSTSAALSRGLSILRAFRRGEPFLGNQELAARTGLPKSTVSRLTLALCELGYLHYQKQTGQYSLSAGVLGLGFTALSSFGVRDVARPVMQGLANRLGASVGLGIRDVFSMMYIEHCHGPGPVQIAIDVGAHIKMLTSAMGRAYLAGLEEKERSSLIKQLAKREGSRWSALRRPLETAIKRYESAGFILSIEDWQTGVHAAAVPLQFGQQSLNLVLNCGAPAYVISAERMKKEVGPHLLKAAAQIRHSIFG